MRKLMIGGAVLAMSAMASAPAFADTLSEVIKHGIVLTIQGDGDMVSEGLQEVLHTAARGENVACIMLNNGVFGETGGHMTATTVLGQRTKTSLDGRDPALHGRPILLSSLLAQIDGAAFVARGAVNSAGSVARTKKLLTRALNSQVQGAGFSFVEILTMCPTGWFIETSEAPQYLESHLAAVHEPGVLKDLMAS